MKEVAPFDLGLVSVSFRKHSPAEIVEAAARVGLRCIEWGSDIHVPSADPENARKVAAMTRNAGLSVCSYGTYFRIGQNKADELPAYFEAARILGTDVLRLWCGTKSYDEIKNEGSWNRLVDECRTLAEMAKAEGMTLAMECHQGTATEDPRGMAELSQSGLPDSFSFYWQPNQFKSVEYNLDYARLAAPLASHIHVFQWKDKDRFPLADGIDEWRGYLALFADRPHKLLLEFMPHDDIAALPREADALREIVKGMQ